MIELGRPAIALMGALLAVVPVALHFISRRAPERAPLPTARFLTPQRLSRVHFQRRPTDLGTLFLRVLFVLTLSSAFAEPRFSRASVGTLDVILLDGSAAMRPFWPSAIDSVRAIVARSERSGALGSIDPAEARAAGGSAALVVFDTTARSISVTTAGLDSLSAAPPADEPGASGGPASSGAFPGGPADLSIALTALRETAVSLSADSARAWLVFAARRDSWDVGLARQREEEWPGIIELVAFVPDSAVASMDPPPLPSPATVVSSSELEAGLIGSALGALGVALAAGTVAAGRPGAILAFGGSAADLSALAGALERGATIVLGPSTHAALTGLDPIWRPIEPRALGPHPLIRFRDGLIVSGVGALPGRAASGARWLAATGDGEPAAVASPVGSGCLVTAAFDPMRIVERAPASLPDVLARLLSGCAPDTPAPDGALPLDAGALEVLRGAGVGGSEPGLGAASPDFPPAVALAALRADVPDPLLVRALLLLALTAAVVEAYFSYLRARGPRVARASA